MRYLGGTALSLPWMALVQFTRASVEEFCCLGRLAAIPPFFCIYSTLIFLWETLPPWLLEYLFHMVLTLLWALAKQTSRIIWRISTWFTKSQWEPCSGLLFKLLATSHLSNEKEEAIWERCQPKGKQGWEMQETWPADTWATDQTQDNPGLPSYGPE